MEKNIKISKAITIISTVLIFCLLVILTIQLIKINNLKEKEKELNLKKATLVEEIYNYNSANEYYGNNREDFLDDYAREIMGYGKNDEKWYTTK